MGEFVFGLLVGAIIGVVVCFITGIQEAKHIEKRTNKTYKPLRIIEVGCGQPIFFSPNKLY